MSNRTPEVGDIWTCGLYDWELTAFIKAGTCQESGHTSNPKSQTDHWHLKSHPGGGTTSWNPLGIESHARWTLKQAASQSQTTTLTVTTPRPVPLPPKKKRYEVSMDNKNWARFDLLDDADPLESYKYRREL